MIPDTSVLLCLPMLCVLLLLLLYMSVSCKKTHNSKVRLHMLPFGYARKATESPPNLRLKGLITNLWKVIELRLSTGSCIHSYKLQNCLACCYKDHVLCLVLYSWSSCIILLDHLIADLSYHMQFSVCDCQSINKMQEISDYILLYV